VTIYFYSTLENAYGCFSNFSAHGFEANGKYWPTVEHFFQAQKFPGMDYEEKIRLAKSPMHAKKMGQTREKPLRADWEDVKDDIMREAVLLKFQTHEQIRDILLGTGSEELVENAPGDFYWGCGADGSGLNRLGVILMEVREQLKQSSLPPGDP
jgi:ribA/ribD-fused uncharacterized protein